MQTQKEQKQSATQIMELDDQTSADKFAPKPLSPRQNVMMTVKIIAILGGVMTLLWWITQSQLPS